MKLLTGIHNWHSKKRWLGGLILVSFALFIVGCAETGSMYTQPYNRPLSASNFFPDGRSARNLVPGTVPQTTQNANDPALTGLDSNGNFITTFPVPVTAALVSRGEERFGIYCKVCHGQDAHGDGTAVTFGFPKPPDLLGSDVKAFPDGKIFNIISHGQGKMLSYGYRVKPPDRWAIISYLRAMQLTGGHLTQPLTAAQLQQLGK